MSAVYRALLGEGDRYLEEAQGYLDGPSKDPRMAAAHATLASALYARAALERPDIGSAIVAAAAAKAGANAAAVVPTSESPQDDPVVTSMNRHPAGKKRVARKAATRNVTPRSAQ